jgi:hypothetical protein
MAKTPPLLTSNDLALATAACALAIAWHKLQPRSGYGANEARQIKRLALKLGLACQHLNPYLGDADAMPLDWGDDPIYGPLPARAISDEGDELSQAAAE